MARLSTKGMRLKRKASAAKGAATKRGNAKAKSGDTTSGLSAKGRKVMAEYGRGELRSGSKSGPAVTDPKQAYAIAKSEERAAARDKRKG